MEFSICLALEGNKEGNRICLRFFFVPLQCFHSIKWNISFIFTSVWRIDRLFCIVLLILDKAGLQAVINLTSLTFSVLFLLGFCSSFLSDFRELLFNK